MLLVLAREGISEVRPLEVFDNTVEVCAELLVIPIKWGLDNS